MQAEPQKEHAWLQKLVGEWSFEGECVMGPDQPAFKSTGAETVRSLGSVPEVAAGGHRRNCGDDSKTIAKERHAVNLYFAARLLYLILSYNVRQYLRYTCPGSL